MSSVESMSYGVPQGSVLGPTLFLIYINELCRLNIPNSNLVVYADDTAITVQGRDWPETRSHAEYALRIVSDWLSNNLLTLNMEKTKFITFAPRIASQPPVPFALTIHNCLSAMNNSCCCKSISRTNSIKYLGVTIDSTMSWNDHIGSLVARVRKLIFVFKKLRSSADLPTLKTVYYALANSILNYCITVWGSSGKCLMLRLERAQRAVLKVMSHKPVRFPTDELYALLQIPRVRHSFLLNSILRKHSELSFDQCFSSQSRQRRRPVKVCPVVPASIMIVRRQYYFISPILYNKINGILNIYHLTSRECKSITHKWLSSMSYEELENFVKT